MAYRLVYLKDGEAWIKTPADEPIRKRISREKASRRQELTERWKEGDDKITDEEADELEKILEEEKALVLEEGNMQLFLAIVFLGGALKMRKRNNRMSFLGRSWRS